MRVNNDGGWIKDGMKKMKGRRPSSVADGRSNPVVKSKSSLGGRASFQFFSALSDEDFFSNNVQHLYFYDEVTDETVHQLQQDIHVASQSTTSATGVIVSPRPIVLHVNSPGGSVYACMSMITIFNQTSVPLCTMTDGFSCSAASLLTIASPYRVAASPHVFTLIHQHSVGIWGTREQTKGQIAFLEDLVESMNRIYLECTTLKAEQLSALMLRDRMLDTSYCSQHGIYDRVLDIKNAPALAAYRRQREEYLDLPINVLLGKSNWNRFVFSTCKGDVQRLDAFLSTPPAETKPVIYYCTPRCGEHDQFYWLAMVARMKAMRVPVYSVTESVVDVWDYLPSLFCMKRYMYTHGFIDIDLQYNLLYGNRLVDIRENTESLLGVLRTILRQKTRLPESVLRELSDRRFTFSAAQCLEYGLCDEIVPLNHMRL